MQKPSIYHEASGYFAIRKVLSVSPGKLIRMTFRKIDGSVRKMTCRLAGTKSTQKYLRVFDVGVRGYRYVNLDRILSVRLDGIELKVQ